MQKLTRAEEQIMQVIWDLEAAFLKEIMEALEEPKPSQSTVSTIIRILSEKGFVDHKAFGKSYQYFPLVSKADYARDYMGDFVGNYFGGSFKKMLSFFIQSEEVDLETLDELMKQEGGEDE